MQKILVTGGCGYIGSHTIIDLIEKGYDVISIDNYVNSSPEVMDKIHKITGVRIHNYEMDLCDFESLKIIFQQNPDINGIIHFAALKAVGESVEKPLLYFRNNLISLINTIDCVFLYGISNLIFSSSCSVYGNADTLPVSEDTPIKEAESPYGRTKQISEQILMDSYKHATSKCISLRYFNPAGAHFSGLLGESPVYTAQNLVPVITETAIGKRNKMLVHGNDYPTRDGSCVRDYIHIMDLAEAHTCALQYLEQHEGAPNYDIFNVGNGKGVSVIEAIKAFEKISGSSLNYHIGPRRPGDVIAIFANADKAQRKLGWSAKYNIEDIMRTAWEWEKSKLK